MNKDEKIIASLAIVILLIVWIWFPFPTIRAQVNSNPSGGALFPNGGSANSVPKFISSNQLGLANLSDNGSTLTTTDSVVISNFSSHGILTVGGQSPPFDPGFLTIGGGGDAGNFSVGPGATFTSSGAGGVMVGVIASGSGLAMTTAAIAAGACGTTVTTTATNTLSTDSIKFSFNAAPAGTNAGLVSWPTNGNVNFAYCPGVAETPAAASINWEVVR